MSGDIYASKLHRDRTVTVWNVFTQDWLRRVTFLPDKIWASLGARERGRVAKHLWMRPDVCVADADELKRIWRDACAAIRMI